LYETHKRLVFVRSPPCTGPTVNSVACLKIRPSMGVKFRGNPRFQKLRTTAILLTVLTYSVNFIFISIQRVAGKFFPKNKSKTVCGNSLKLRYKDSCQNSESGVGKKLLHTKQTTERDCETSPPQPQPHTSTVDCGEIIMCLFMLFSMVT